MPEKLPGPATLETIARKVGVSKNTVSIALRNKVGVSKETRHRILQVAEELGYRPNPMISALMHNLRATHPPKSQANIAFVHAYESQSAWMQKPYCLHFFNGIQERCKQTGYHASVFWACERGMSPERLHKIMLAQGICGIIISPLVAPRRHLRLYYDDFALSTTGYSLWCPAIHRVSTDLRDAMSIAVRQLKKLNYKRIGVLYCPLSDSRVNYSWTASLAVERAKHPQLLTEPLAESNPSQSSIRSWLKRNRPDVVVAAGVEGMTAKLNQLRYKVPDDIGFVDIYDDPCRDLNTATVLRTREAVGAAAMDLIVAQLLRNERGIPKTRRTILLQGTWQPGQTVRKQET